MKNIFIGLTMTDDTKFCLNILHPVLIEPNKNGTTLISNSGGGSFQKKVKESYDDIKSLMASMN
jgi:hypothetical protein